MSGSHGDLFGEIGKLVLAAQAGQEIDLDAKSEELAERYRALGVSEEIIAKSHHPLDRRDQLFDGARIARRQARGGDAARVARLAREWKRPQRP